MRIRLWEWVRLAAIGVSASNSVGYIKCQPRNSLDQWVYSYFQPIPICGDPTVTGYVPSHIDVAFDDADAHVYIIQHMFGRLVPERCELRQAMARAMVMSAMLINNTPEYTSPYITLPSRSKEPINASDLSRIEHWWIEKKTSRLSAATHAVKWHVKGGVRAACEDCTLTANMFHHIKKCGALLQVKPGQASERRTSYPRAKICQLRCINSHHADGTDRENNPYQETVIFTAARSLGYSDIGIHIRSRSGSEYREYVDVIYARYLGAFSRQQCVIPASTASSEEPIPILMDNVRSHKRGGTREKDQIHEQKYNCATSRIPQYPRDKHVLAMCSNRRSCIANLLQNDCATACLTSDHPHLVIDKSRIGGVAAENGYNIPTENTAPREDGKVITHTRLYEPV